MKIKVEATTLMGEIRIPYSKTHIHRILFMALLEQGITKVKIDKNSYESKDILETINVLKIAGAKITYVNKKEAIYMNINSENLYDSEEKTLEFIFYESATTLRISILVLMHLFKKIKLKISQKLMERSIDFWEEIFFKYGIFYDKEIIFKNNENYTYIQIEGDISKIFNKNMMIDKINSSQYISALMCVFPLVNQSFKIQFKNGVESEKYLLVTRNIIEKYGVNMIFEYNNVNKLKSISMQEKNIKIKYKNINCLAIQTPQIDFSSFAFWYVANDLGSNINFLNYDKEKKYDHPDKEIIDIIEQIKNYGNEINLINNPDLLPILLVWACFQNKQIYIINFQRNRLKESNRVENMVNQLNLIGSKIKIDKKKISIHPIKKFNNKQKQIEINGYNDHRIVMSFCIAALKSQTHFVIDGKDAVNKSYPRFWNDFEKLGGKYDY